MKSDLNILYCDDKREGSIWFMFKYCGIVALSSEFTVTRIGCSCTIGTKDY